MSALRRAASRDLAPLPAPHDRALRPLRQRLRADRRGGGDDGQRRVRRGRRPQLPGVVRAARPASRTRLLRIGAAPVRATRRAHDRRRRGARWRGGGGELARHGRDRRRPVAVGGPRPAPPRAARHAARHRGRRGRALRRRAHQRHARTHRRSGGVPARDPPRAGARRRDPDARGSELSRVERGARSLVVSEQSAAAPRELLRAALDSRGARARRFRGRARHQLRLRLPDPVGRADRWRRCSRVPLPGIPATETALPADAWQRIDILAAHNTPRWSDRLAFAAYAALRPPGMGSMLRVVARAPAALR